MPRIFTLEQEEYVRTSSHLTYTQIAKDLNCSRKQIYKLVDRLGITRLKHVSYGKEDIEYLREVIKKNPEISISKLAKAIGRTRGSTSAVLHRLGIKLGTWRPKTKFIPKPKPVQPPQPKRILPVFPQEPPPEARKTLFQLGNHDCHYPYGNPKSPSFRYCGLPCERIYCLRHEEVVYDRSEALVPLEDLL